MTIPPFPSPGPVTCAPAAIAESRTAMAIEIVVGLPHLSEGPILQRARAMGVPTLISANCLSRWKKCDGCREWSGWRLGTLANARGLASLDLDSGGYVAMSRYNGIPWSVDEYMTLAASYPFRRFASLDYCTEEGVARDREEVLDRISRTIRANRDCRMRAADLGIADRLMPVIQGRLPSDFERCLDALPVSMTPGTVIGIGSMCRRRLFGPEGLIAVFEHIDRILPEGVMCHGFGVKGDCLPYLRGLEHRICSLDSQAFGTAARYDANKRGVSKTDRLGRRPYGTLDPAPDGPPFRARPRAAGRTRARSRRSGLSRSMGARDRAGASRNQGADRGRLART